MGLGSGDGHAKYLATSMVRRLVSPPYERRNHLLPVVPSFADDDDAIELLSLGLMHRHDLHAGRIVDAAKNLVLRESEVEHVHVRRCTAHHASIPHRVHR